MTYSLDQSLFRLAVARKDLMLAKEALDEVEAEAATTLDPFRAAVAKTKAELAAAETDVKERAHIAYEEDPSNNKPSPYVVMKHFTDVSWPEAKALAWAIEHKMALALDAKVFGTIAKSAAAPDFVVRTDTVKPTISTDLTPLLTPEPKQ